MAYTTIDDPEKYMQVKAYTGNGSDDHAITLDGDTDMQPDLVWIKNREEETSDDTHFWFDSVRGVTKYLISSGDGAQVTDADTLDAFQSDGFKVDDDVKCNTSSEKYVAFCWKESTDAGFDIVSYTGNATARTISHNLSAIPETIICKETSASAPFGNQAWSVYHKGITANKYMVLNATQAEADDAGDFNDTDPTSSVFSVGNGNRTNASSGVQIAYVFKEKQGFSKFGKFTWGTSNTDGAFIWLGFRPSFFMIKKTSGSAAWYLWNSKTNGYNGSGGNTALFPYHVSVEDAGTTIRIDLLSNGVKFRHADGDHNGSGATYIFWAWAEAPFVNSNGVPCNAR
jgi:hypothetical protein